MSDRAVLRRRAALTQAQLARLTGISAPRIVSGSATRSNYVLNRSSALRECWTSTSRKYLLSTVR